jgi:hypothetical protein
VCRRYSWMGSDSACPDQIWMKIHHAHRAVRITVEWPPTAWRHNQYYDHALLRVSLRTEIAKRARRYSSDRRHYAEWLRDDEVVAQMQTQSEDNTKIEELEQVRAATDKVIDEYCKANFLDEKGLTTAASQRTREEVVQILGHRYKLSVAALHESFDKVTKRLTKEKYRPTGTKFKAPDFLWPAS